MLKELYREILIPQAVYEETVIHGIKYGFEDAYTFRLFLNQNNWKSQKLSQIPQAIASANLDKGEKEAIALRLSNNALLLMDEELGRIVAREQGLKIKGSLGVLIEAYRKKLISVEQLRFYFMQISSRNDIWISPKLCNKLLKNIDDPTFKYKKAHELRSNPIRSTTWRRATNNQQGELCHFPTSSNRIQQKRY